MFIIAEVSWLRGCDSPDHLPYVRPPGRHSHLTDSVSFPRTKRRNFRVSFGRRFVAVKGFLSESPHLLGIDSSATHWQALPGRSWLSYSRPRDLPAVPGVINSGSTCCHVADSPRQHGLNGRFAPESPRDGLAIRRSRTALSMTASVGIRRLKFSRIAHDSTLRPLSSGLRCIDRLSDRMLRLFWPAIRGQTGLLQQASVERSEHLSMHRALQQTA